MSLLLSLFVITGTYAQVQIDYIHSVDFSNYKSFTFKKGKVVNNVVIDSSITKESNEIKNFTVTEFEKKGMIYTDSNPDLIISFVSQSRPAAQLADMGPAENGTGAGSYGNLETRTWREDFNPSYARIYSENIFTIDITDAKTHRLVWRGISKIKGNTPDAMRRSMHKKIKKITKRYPKEK